MLAAVVGGMIAAAGVIADVRAGWGWPARPEAGCGGERRSSGCLTGGMNRERRLYVFYISS